MSRHGIAQIVFCVNGKEYPFDPVQIGYTAPVDDDEDIGEPGSKMFEVKSVVAAAVEPDRAVRLDEHHALALAEEMIEFVKSMRGYEQNLPEVPLLKALGYGAEICPAAPRNN